MHDAVPQRLGPLARWLSEKLAPLGYLSPFATLESFSPGARRLLQDTERDAERLLHVVRLVLIVATTLVILFGFGMINLFPGPLLVLMGVLGTTVWVLIWRHLSKGL